MKGKFVVAMLIREPLFQVVCIAKKHGFKAQNKVPEKVMNTPQQPPHTS